ncbi:MAG: hypothetical protein Q9182_001270 [Xanthomendoza sp. 2 TL-2023]
MYSYGNQVIWLESNEVWHSFISKCGLSKHNYLTLYENYKFESKRAIQERLPPSMSPDVIEREILRVREAQDYVHEFLLDRNAHSVSHKQTLHVHEIFPALLPLSRVQTQPLFTTAGSALASHDDNITNTNNISVGSPDICNTTGVSIFNSGPTKTFIKTLAMEAAAFKDIMALTLSKKAQRKISKEQKRAIIQASECLSSSAVWPVKDAGHTAFFADAFTDDDAQQGESSKSDYVATESSSSRAMDNLAVEIPMTCLIERHDAVINKSCASAGAMDDKLCGATSKQSSPLDICPEFAADGSTDPTTNLMRRHDESADEPHDTRTQRWVDENLYIVLRSPSSSPPASDTLQPPSVETATEPSPTLAAAHTNDVLPTERTSPASERRSLTSTLVEFSECHKGLGNAHKDYGLADVELFDRCTSGYDWHSSNPSNDCLLQNGSFGLYTPAPTAPVGRLFPYDWSPGPTPRAAIDVSERNLAPSPQRRCIARPRQMVNSTSMGRYEQSFRGTAPERYEKLRHPNWIRDARGRFWLPAKEFRSIRLFREYTLKNYGCGLDQARYLPDAKS